MSTMNRMKLAAWLVEAGYEACGQQFAAVDTDRAPRTDYLIADQIDGVLPQEHELLPEKLREWARVQDGTQREPLPLAEVLAFWVERYRQARRIDGNHWSEPHVVIAAPEDRL